MPLTFAPENGHMLGGTMVNLTGPCFQPAMRVTCRFNTKDSEGIVLNENRFVLVVVIIVVVVVIEFVADVRVLSFLVSIVDASVRNACYY